MSTEQRDQRRRTAQSGMTACALALIVATMLTAVCRTPAAAAVPIIRPEPMDATVVAGDVVTVSIVIIGAQEAYGIDVSARFDPSIVEVVDADAAQPGIQLLGGPFLQPDFVVRNTADNISGTLQYAVTQVNPTAPASGDGTIVSFMLRGKAPGWQSALTIGNVILANRDGTTLPVAMQHGAITVTGDEAETPAATATTVVTATRTETPAPATATPLPAPATPTELLPPMPPTRTSTPLLATTATAQPTATVAATATLATGTPPATPGTESDPTRVSVATGTVAASVPATNPAVSATRAQTQTPAPTGTVAPAATGARPATLTNSSQTATAAATPTIVSGVALAQPAVLSTQMPVQPTALHSAAVPLGPAPAAPQREALLGLDPLAVLGGAMIAAGTALLAGLFYVSFRRR